jgi:hypothetical protein
MKHVKNGCLSDHSDVQLYLDHEVQNDDINFKKLKCSRGTSQLEGFHRYIGNCLGGKTMSPKLVDALLLNMVFRWNSDRAVASKQEYNHGCYSIDVMESINNLYHKNKRFFNSRPINFQEIDYSQELESFGCSHVKLPSVIDDSKQSEEDRIEEQIEVVPEKVLELITEIEVIDEELSDLPPLEQNNEIVKKIEFCPYPKHFRTQEEMDLLIDILNSYEESKIDFNCLSQIWNQKIIHKVSETAFENLKSFYQTYSFKTAYQLKKFKERCDDIFIGRKKLEPYKERINLLQKNMRTDASDHLAPIPVAAIYQETLLISEDVELLENTQEFPEEPPVFIKKRKKASPSIDNLYVEFGKEFVEQILDENIELCANCKKPRKIGMVFQTEHSQRTCPDGVVTKIDKNEMDRIRKKIKRTVNLIEDFNK